MNKFHKYVTYKSQNTLQLMCIEQFPKLSLSRSVFYKNSEDEFAKPSRV